MNPPLDTDAATLLAVLDAIARSLRNTDPPTPATTGALVHLAGAQTELEDLLDDHLRAVSRPDPGSVGDVVALLNDVYQALGAPDSPSQAAGGFVAAALSALTESGR